MDDLERFPSFARAALRALQARNLPRVRAAEFFSVSTELQLPADVEKANAQLMLWDEYFAQFTPITDGKCICCGEFLGAFTRRGVDLLLGSGFEWGLIHGEGCCRYCRYPMRGHHIPKGDIGKIHNLFLPYHPGVLSFDAREGYPHHVG